MDKFSLEPHHEPTAPLTNQDAEVLGSQADPISINCAAASSELSCASCVRASQYEQPPSRGRTSTLQSSGQYWFYADFEDGVSIKEKTSREQPELAANTALKTVFSFASIFFSSATTINDPQPARSVILPSISMDIGLLLISIGAVNLWRARQNSN